MIEKRLKGSALEEDTVDELPTDNRFRNYRPTTLRTTENAKVNSASQPETEQSATEKPNFRSRENTLLSAKARLSLRLESNVSNHLRSRLSSNTNSSDVQPNNNLNTVENKPALTNQIDEEPIPPLEELIPKGKVTVQNW